MNNFQKLATGVDVLPLMHAIQRRPDLWKEDTYLREFPQGPFKSMESIILRFNEKGTFETKEALDAHFSDFGQHENYDQPAYKTLHEARPIVMGLMTRVGGERLGRVLINKISPGGSIYPHADTLPHAEYWSRYHVVLDSQPGVDFRCGDEHVYMATGELWWFNSKVEHEVKNASRGDRVHMVVDIRTSR